MAKKRLGKNQNLYCGREINTPNGRVGVVDRYAENGIMWVRYPSKTWPFPQWDFFPAKLVSPVPFEVEEAPF